MKVVGSKGNQYEVTWISCTCPDYMYRKSKLGGICKHIKQFREKYPEMEKDKNNESLGIDLSKFDEGLCPEDTGLDDVELDKLVRKGMLRYDRKDNMYSSTVGYKSRAMMCSYVLNVIRKY